MLDRDELIAHFEWLSGSKCYDEALGEAALAIELCAAGHDWELMRYGAALMTAGGVVGVFGLEPFVDRVREARATGRDLALESLAEDRRSSASATESADGTRDPVADHAHTVRDPKPSDP